MLRRYWSKFIVFDWKLGVFLILLFGIIRFVIVLNANLTGDFKYVSFIFVIMALIPFILLNKNGLRSIGITWTTNPKWLLFSFLAGILCCLLMYWIGLLLFQETGSNWFISIGNTYPLDFNSITEKDRLVYFVVFSFIGMTFSPIAEELMYRGMIHESLVNKFGERQASLIDSGAFGITHLAHFGLIYVLGQWKLMVLPALLWMLLIFSSGLIFNLAKRKSGSIVGAIISHAGFNIAMTYVIFYRLFN